jgi:N-acyl-D-amino-acid deacylase
MLIALLQTLLSLLPAQTPPFDILITNSRVIDGAGTPWFKADIGIRGDAIAAIGLLRDHPARIKVDARGLTVTPGFIDVHSHADRDIFNEPTAKADLYQGVTTLIGGPDGSSPLPLKPALEKLSQLKMSVNMGLCVGHGSVRRMVLSMDNRAPTSQELERMKQLTRQAMLDGAIGLSTGLFYTPANFAKTEEVIELAKIAGQYGGFHVSHVRDEGLGIIDSVRETIRIGEEGGIPTQITHAKIGGKINAGKSADMIRLMNEARARGVDATIDQYPYTASHTGLGAALIPQWAFGGGPAATKERMAAPEQRARIKTEIVRTNCGFDRSLQFKSLADILRSRGKEPTMDNAAELAIEIQLKGGCSAVFHWINEQDIERILQYPWTMVASDGSLTMNHPRSYGAYARVLGRYVRERKVITLEDAVRKMSGLPAQRARIYDRGLIRPGMKADLVILDPDKVEDKSTYEKPSELAVGVRDVVVNGKFVLRDGQVTEERSGRVLYGPGYKP